MTNSTTLSDITEISTKLNGKVEAVSISTSQILPCDKGQSINGLLFIDKKFGLWFYTDRYAFDNICYLKSNKFPTYVVCEGSNTVYELK